MSADTFDELSEELRREYGRRNKAALLQAVFHAAQERRRLPEWAAEAFEAAYAWIMSGGARSWDDAFGTPHRTNKHLRKRVNDSKRFAIYSRVLSMSKEKKIGVGDELFELVGEEFGLKKTKVGELYSRVKGTMDRLRSDGHTIAIPQPSSRKASRTPVRRRKNPKIPA